MGKDGNVYRGVTMDHQKISIWEIWTNKLDISAWAADYCINIKDDPLVRYYITSLQGAVIYTSYYGNKDERVSKIIKFKL